MRACAVARHRLSYTQLVFSLLRPRPAARRSDFHSFIIFICMGAMSVITVTKAMSVADLDAAAKVRCAVFADEFAYLDSRDYPAGREVDGFDVLPTTVNFVGRVDGQTAGTVRLLFANPCVAARCNIRHGLSIERHLDLKRFRLNMSLAEIPRSSVLKPFRRTGVMHHLYFAAYVECLRRGVTHWIAVGNTETDCAADAAVVMRLLEARGLWRKEFDAEPREVAAPAREPRYRLYTEAHHNEIRRGNLNAVPLPRTLELFAKVGARYFGTPFYDAGFRMFAMPLILDMKDFVHSPYGTVPLQMAA